MPRMKTSLLSLSLLLSAPLTQAASFQISTSDANLGNTVLAKNCIDYTVCGGTGTSLAGGPGGYRFHSFVNLGVVDASRLLYTCDFADIGTSVSIKHLSSGKFLPIPNGPGQSKAFSATPNLYIPNMSEATKRAKQDKIRALIEAGDRVGAVKAVIREYGFNTQGYRFELLGDMGSAGAVTDHQKKLIQISESGFRHPCNLIQNVRHELEHATQMTRAIECLNNGERHNLEDHVARERSAYLNDIRTIPQFCADPAQRDHLVRFYTETFLDSYTRN
jgi:hypothetical protein